MDKTHGPSCENDLIQPMEVARDKDGWWSHPGIPVFDEGQEEEYRAWLDAHGLKVTYRMLEWDPEHPLYDAWFEDGVCDCSTWTPSPPTGEGWFTLSIHDTEDGPVWVWARRITATATQAVAQQAAPEAPASVDGEKGGAA